MGTYKVIQDIEAEDKLLGPLTLWQFIYVIIVLLIGFIAFQFSRINLFLIIPFIPPMIFFGMLAAPIGKDQPSDVWLLAKIRFILKPRKRIWDQSGIIELVTITAPKKIEKILTKNLSQTEVRSRLEALANTIDSRGWAVKNVNVNMFAQPSYVLGQADSDRLIDPTTMAQNVPNLDIAGADDVFDTQSSRAQALDQMIATSTQAHKQQLLKQMQRPQTSADKPADYWFLNQAPEAPTQPGMAVFDKSQVVTPGQELPHAKVEATPSANEQALLDKIHKEKALDHKSHTHMKTLNPIGDEPAAPPAPKPVNPNIADLSRNDDLNIATISRQANKPQQKDDDGEVTISLR